MAARWLACTALVLCLFAAGIVLGADAKNPTDDAEGHVLPEVTVIAPADSNYTTMPPRDLIARPFTESPGLETATSVLGRKEIEQMHAYSVIDAMKYVPGAWTETRGRKEKSLFSVRGQRYPYPG
ncbi:MAG: Plug domain-containing protein, partial [Sedimentisphaerales bacterium]|nr:Plug domain-containing protein [Sedimentisphaerales bacterium]